ncbi:MAG: fibronectin type III domain-containing protein [Flavobacteriales bacterium]|nr:fibronectin type III domain-containing protein [Flavobacteriales bacterium]
MKQVIRVVVRLKGRSALAKMEQARFTVSKMHANVNFPTLAGQVTALETATDTLESAITAANTGDHEKVAVRKLAEGVVLEGLNALCSAINGVAPNDMDKLVTCGFPLRKEPQPKGELDPPTKLVYRLTKTTGRAALVWNGEDGTRLFNVHQSTQSEPFNWVAIGSTTKRRFNVDSLTPGEFYWFSISAVGTAGESSLSEPVRVMAAA